MASNRAPSPKLAWSITALAAAFLLLLLVSLLAVVRIPAPKGTIRLCYGGLDYFSPPTLPPGFSVSLRGPFPLVLLPSWGTLRGGPFFVLPLWMPAAGFGFIASRLFRRIYGVPQGHCKTCRYDLRENLSGRCPECGAPVPAEGTV